MNIKFFIIIILIFTIFFNNVYSQTYQEKDPFVAGLLSSVMMGLGQFYAKEYTKGSLFILLDLLDKGTLLWMVVALNEKYTNDIDKTVEWKEITDNDKALIISYIGIHYGLQIFCIIDAVYSAKKYNEEIKKYQSFLNNFNFTITKNNNFILSYSNKF
jgi:hypothetical protein